MGNNYKKSELTRFAKECVSTVDKALTLLCVCEEIRTSDIGREIAYCRSSGREDLILEVSKRFAKYCDADCPSDIKAFIVDFEEFYNMLKPIMDCCDDNDWFCE